MDKVIEYIILGAPDVGKTSLLARYIDNIFLDNSYVTLGVSMRTKYITNYTNYNIKLNIYDTAGQERYYPIVNNFIKNKQCIILCFSLVNSYSFEQCKIYDKKINELKDDNTILILVGTFLDMKDKCKNINKIDLDNFINMNNYRYFEISSKTGEGVRELFDCILKIMVDNNLGKIENKSIINLSNISQFKYNNCCRN